MTQIEKAKSDAFEVINIYPQLEADINEAYEMMLDEIEAGESEDNEVGHFYSRISDLIISSMRTHSWENCKGAQELMNTKNIEVTDMDWQSDQYPEFEDSSILEANWKDSGKALTDDEIDKLNEDSQFVYEELQSFLY
jgi:hypothetical protein